MVYKVSEKTILALGFKTKQEAEDFIEVYKDKPTSYKKEKLKLQLTFLEDKEIFLEEELPKILNIQLN